MVGGRPSGRRDALDARSLCAACSDLPLPSLHRLVPHEDVAGEVLTAPRQCPQALFRGPQARLWLERQLGELPLERTSQEASRAHVPEQPGQIAVDDMLARGEQRIARALQRERPRGLPPFAQPARRSVLQNSVERRRHGFERSGINGRFAVETTTPALSGQRSAVLPGARSSHWRGAGDRARV